MKREFHINVSLLLYEGTVYLGVNAYQLCKLQII